MIKYLPFMNVFLGFLNLGMCIIFSDRQPVMSGINLFIGIFCVGIGVVGILTRKV